MGLFMNKNFSALFNCAMCKSVNGFLFYLLFHWIIWWEGVWGLVINKNLSTSFSLCKWIYLLLAWIIWWEGGVGDGCLGWGGVGWGWS